MRTELDRRHTTWRGLVAGVLAATLAMMKRLYRKPRGGRRRSFRQVALALNDAGRPTRQGGPWQAATVRGILMRRTKGA